jgi:N6-adenosine-specific RNA methylase IME4
MDISSPFNALRAHHYAVVLADPPWRFVVRSSKGEKKSPQSHYNCMSLEEIRALPVDQLADPAGCTLLLWATAPMIPAAIETMEAWNFTYKTMAAWAKQSSTGMKWAFGTGYIFRSAAEFILVGTQGRPKQKARNVRNLIVSPIREHSRKPDIHPVLESLWDGPYCELFSRQPRPGWDAFGDQPDLFHHNDESVFSFQPL